MTFRSSEIDRLRRLAGDRWGIDGHVLPFDLAYESLEESIRSGALEYFDNHSIKWWKGPRDLRPPDSSLPTGYLTSSQVACVNHLEKARTDQEVANQLIASIVPSAVAVELEDGFLEYEWIGSRSYLNESGARVRGANVTSLDAVMCADTVGERLLIAIEWKYLESYGALSVARSVKGTDRVSTYVPLIERHDSPIRPGPAERMFYSPYEQLMRQTLLAWQMTEHREFGATDWIHLHVIPDQNVALLRGWPAAPDLEGTTMPDKWRSVLKEPSRYRSMTPTQLLGNILPTSRTAEWRACLAERYLT